MKPPKKYNKLFDEYGFWTAQQRKKPKRYSKRWKVKKVKGVGGHKRKYKTYKM